MHDYQLERLNTRSFEQLVQALGLEIIGKQLMIFGDGPDGGREATFEGPVKYPEGKDPWDGYGMVQAKFRQIPDSVAKKNADWAIAQLKSEFKKLKPRPKGKTGSLVGARICPEYYIFATNLSLSAVAAQGGKDRVRETLEGFKKTHGLKSYAIWDGDQIRRFIDAQPTIRTTYLAWLLPGDVLAEVMKQLELDRVDFLSTIRRYLESELLDDQYAKLGQGGYTDANAIPLSNVFVDLPVDLHLSESLANRHYPKLEIADSEVSDDGSEIQHRQTFLKLFFEEGRQVLKPSANPIQLNETFDLRRTCGRVVLIGGPGQGKTTVGLFTCQLLRAALLRVSGATYSPEVTHALAIIENQSKDLPKACVLRYPLRVDLKKLAEALAGVGDFAATSLLDYLVKHISKRTDSDLSKAEFRKWLKFYPWLLVLDGLDEVPASSNRTKMMDVIRDFVSVEAHQQDADLLILATTRPQGYSDEFDPALYRHLPLAPLNSSEALQYGSKLAMARHPGLKTRVEQLINSLSRATTNSATVRLMESPLQVTIMLALIEGGGEPPEQRWKLFHDYYDVIYRREKERGTPFSSILRKYEPDIHWLHHRAGWVLQQRNAGTGATAARLTHTEFETMVNERLLKRGHEDIEKRSILVQEIREAATDRLVFLVGNTANEIGFEIRSLQEFMAAEHCFDGPESCVQDTVREIAPHPYWRNVFLFVAGRIFFEKESLIDSLVVVCERLNEEFNDPAQGFIYSGSRLAVAMLRDGAARNQPQNIRVLARCAAKLLDFHDPDEALGILDLFKSDGCEVWKNELFKRLEKNCVHFPHLAWRLCFELADNSEEWARKAILSQFPWRHNDVDDFFSRTIISAEFFSISFADIFEDNILGCTPEIFYWINRSKISLESLGCEGLVQFKNIISPSKSEKNIVNLLDYNLSKTCNSLNLHSSDRIDAWAALKLTSCSIEDMHPRWRTYHAISNFSRELTAESLAAQILIIFKDDPSFGVLESRTSPWQIHACVVARESGIPEVEIISAINAGALGSAKDWDLWREQSYKGVEISSLGFPNGLFSVSENCRGAIFNAAGWRHQSGNPFDDFVFVDALGHALPKLMSESEIAKTLINLCCFGLSSVGSDWSLDQQEVVVKFINYCGDMNVQVTREIIVAVVASSMIMELKRSLLAVIGSRIGSQSWLHDWSDRVTEINECCEQIVLALDGCPQLPSILCALSFLPPLPFWKKIPPDALVACCFGGDDQRLALIVMKINTLKWEVKDADVFASDICRLKNKYPNYLRELLEFIESKGVNGVHLEAFLLALTKLLNQDYYSSLRGQISRLLVKLVERRPAINSLPDPAAPKPLIKNLTFSS